MRVAFVVFFMLILAGSSGCLFLEDDGSVHLVEIMKKKSTYEEELLMVRGLYGGRDTSLPCDWENMIGASGNDLILYEDEVCVFMDPDIEFIEPDYPLDPSIPDDVGKKTMVYAHVKLIGNRIYLRKES